MPVVYKSICSLFVLHYSTYTIIRWTILRVRQRGGSLMEDRLGKCDERWGEGSPWACQVAESSALRFHCQSAVPYLTNKALFSFPLKRLFASPSARVIVSARSCFVSVVLSTFYLFTYLCNPGTPDGLVNLQPHPEEIYFILGGIRSSLECLQVCVCVCGWPP